jgi:DNA-binding NarL/FixJ family response regulator
MPRVFIASGDAEFCQALRSVFESDRDFLVCGEAKSESGAVDMVKKLAPDLIVLETTPSGDFKIARVIKAVLPEASVFMITVQNDLRAEKEALSHGIDAVFVKEDISSLVVNARAVCGLE